ncbi:helix-turn-helix domain-containing protein [Flintibacter muris]|uniref:helix-turn-helix domain-containing protein n=1 Tax=Flintibacter muris TaxID=2941327 RepID=UPI00203AFE1E|nr:helix-turn-helix domain-containing protein [Flintibacter muris]
MDNEHFGAFIAQLRKELGLTQKELADRLNVTDKAVSKWETGKGFPDVKLLEPLAQALGVSLVELMQGKRQEADTLTVAEAGVVVSQAMGQSEKNTARRYLKIFRWCLTAVCALCLVWLCPQITQTVILWKYLHSFAPSGATEIGVIGGADGPTAIITASHPTNSLPLDLFLLVGIPLLLLITCIVLAVKVWRLEKKLK